MVNTNLDKSSLNYYNLALSDSISLITNNNNNNQEFNEFSLIPATAKTSYLRLNPLMTEGERKVTDKDAIRHQCADITRSLNENQFNIKVNINIMKKEYLKRYEEEVGKEPMFSTFSAMKDAIISGDSLDQPWFDKHARKYMISFKDSKNFSAIYGLSINTLEEFDSEIEIIISAIKKLDNNVFKDINSIYKSIPDERIKECRSENITRLKHNIDPINEEKFLTKCCNEFISKNKQSLDDFLLISVEDTEEERGQKDSSLK